MARSIAGEHLVADFDAVAVSVDGEPIRLTRREFELLRFLVENKNRVLSRDRLLERVWGYDRFIETRSVDVHVGRLRAKLGTVGHADRDRRRAGLPVRRLTSRRDRVRPSRRPRASTPPRSIASGRVRRGASRCSCTTLHEVAVRLFAYFPAFAALREW